MDYKTIRGEVSATIIEKRSRFIATARPVSELTEAESFLAQIRSKNPDARHNVFACLLLEGTRRCSDDGEPQGTAGLPALEAIGRRGLVNVAVVITRYFGGVLLGAPGLLRAYSGAAATALDAAVIRTMSHCRVYEMTVDYGLLARTERLMETLGCHIKQKLYQEKATLEVLIPDDIDLRFNASVADVSNGLVKPVVKGEMFWSE